MENPCCYVVRVRGALCESDMMNDCPLEAHILESGDEFSLLQAHTDQAGLIGWLRYLHGSGFTLLSFERKENTDGFNMGGIVYG